MNSERNKQENKQAFKKTLPIIIAAGIFGGIVGALAVTDSAADVATFLGTKLETMLKVIAPYMVMLTSVAGLVINFALNRSARKEFEKHQDIIDEDEAEKIYMQIDKKVSYAMLVGSTCLILNFMFYGVVMAYINYYVEEGMIGFGISLIFFVISSLGNTKLQQMSVDLEKLMMPEKKGSVYDLKFSEKWEESCDEYEKYTIYKSAYASYKATSKAYAIAVIGLMLMSLFFGYGPLPIIVVCCLWLVSITSYCLTAMKLEKEKIN